jgi:hypothetical protein
MEDRRKPGCLSGILSLLALIGLVYGVYYLRNMQFQGLPVSVQAEVKRYLEDPNRKRSTRDSGEVPSVETDLGVKQMKEMITTEIEKNLSTFKAVELTRMANQNGCRMFNFIESANHGEVWIWYVKKQNARRFLEHAKLMGAIHSYDADMRTSESQEGKYTIYISKIEVRW